MRAVPILAPCRARFNGLDPGHRLCKTRSEARALANRVGRRYEVGMNPKFAIPLIIVAVLAWGALHAYGAYTYNQIYNPWRFCMVLGCECLFVAFWVVMLLARRSRLRRQDRAPL